MMYPVCDPATVDNITIELQNSWRNVMINLGFRDASMQPVVASQALARSTRCMEFDRCPEKVDAVVSWVRSAQPDGRPVTAGSGSGVGGIFQLVGFRQFPKASSEAMEPIFKPQALGGGHRFDLGEDGFPQIVFD